MAEAIRIQVVLEPKDIATAGTQIVRQLQNALDAELSTVKTSGKKIGDALSSATEEALRRGEQKLQIIREQSAARQAAIAAKAAADEQRIRAKALADHERDLRRFEEAQQRALNRAKPPDNLLAFFRRFSSTIREAGESIQQAGQAFLGVTRGILDLGRAAVTSAVNIDRQVNVLKALTGSAAAAEERFKALVATAARSPGLTTTLATTLDAQLRVANASAQSIDKLLPVIGRLNAVSPLGDPQRFAQNLIQLVTQNFERTDLKELAGQSPLAGELVKTLFNVDSPTNAKAIRESAKKLGITTVDALANGLAGAAASNSKLAGVTESLGTQIEKIRDRIVIAFAPLGKAILDALQPLVEKAVPIIERLSKAFAELPQSAQEAIIIVGGLVAALGPLVIALGGLIQTFGALGNIITVIAGVGGTAGAGAGLAGIGATLSGLLPIIGAVVLAVGGLAAAWATDFGGMRKITDDFFSFVQEEATDAAVDLRSIIPSLGEVKSGFQELSNDVKPIFQELFEAFRGAAKLGIESVKVIISEGIEAYRTIKSVAESVGDLLGSSLAKQLTLGVFNGLSLLSKNLPAVIANIATGGVASFTVPFDKLGKARRDINADVANSLAIEAELEKRVGPGNNFVGPSVSEFDIQKARFEKQGSSKLGGTGARDGRSADGEARQLREAQLRFTKETLEQQQRLIEDSNKRELETIQEKFKNEEISIREFYEAKTGIEQANIGNSINIIQREIQATEESLRAAKANTPEKIRLESELLKLRTELELKTRALTDAEVDNQRKFLDAATQKKLELLKETQKLALPSGERTGELPTDQIARTLTPVELEAQRKLKEANELKRQANLADIATAQQELQIQQAITAGVISEAEGKEATLAIQRQLRDVLIASLEAQKQLETDPEKLARLNLEIQKLANLGQQLTPAQAFFKGLRSDAETTAESFERIGTNLKDKFLSVLDSGIDKLTQKFGFFKDLIGDIIKSLTRKVISQLFGLGGNAGGGFAPSGGGGFNLGGILGGIFGGGQQQGGSGGGFNIANLFGSSQIGVPGSGFLTGGFAGGNPAGAILSGNPGSANLGSIIQNLFGGGGLTSPASISLPGLGGTAGINPILQGDFGAGGAGLGAAGSLAGLKQLLAGVGFGKAPGSGGALAGLLPLLGVGLGSGLGTDSLTKILGGVGGGLLGIGLTAAPSIIGAGGALSGLGFLGPLFSNPITAAIGAAILPAVFLLGRARQRGRDERASGDFLQDAIDAIRELRKQVASDQIDGPQARNVFNNEILATFISQINTLKTKSVRESRLKNQVADLKKLFEDEVAPEIELQKTRAKTVRQLIPEFANSGVVPGVYRGFDDTIVKAHAGEMFLNRYHQAAIAQIAGGDVFQRVGVPSAPSFEGGVQTLALGGTVQSAPAAFSSPSVGGAGGPIVITVERVEVIMGSDSAADIVFVGAQTDKGQRAIIGTTNDARINRLTK